MKNYYSGRHARHYNRQWGTFTEHTLAQVLNILEQTRQSTKFVQPGQRLRVLDVACGTGLLLQQIVARMPQVEAYGVDASRDMLAQARKTLGERPNVHLEYAEVGPGERANLPYTPASFDLITCTKALHDMHDPLEILKGLMSLLLSEDFLVLEDYARRSSPFPWTAFEWLLRRIEGNYMRAYTLEEARTLCTQANFQGETSYAFMVDWLWLDPRAAVQEFMHVIEPGGLVIYTFCSLPEGTPGNVLTYVRTRASSKESPLTHLLPQGEQPFHHCEYSSLKRFAGGLTTVATVGTCCTVTNGFVLVDEPQVAKYLKR